MQNEELILGWDVGGTKSAAVVGTAQGEVLAREAWASDAHEGPRHMLDVFLAHARALRGRFAGVARVGVSIGGPLNTRTGEILSPPHLPGWDHIPLTEILRRELGLPVVVEHDAAACLEAEWLWGAAVGATHAAYLTCGTGFGAGVMIDGRVLRGPAGQSPEIGHVRLADDGPVMFGKAGCSESFCSGEGLPKLAAMMFPNRFAAPDRNGLEDACNDDAETRGRDAGVPPASGEAGLTSSNGLGDGAHNAGETPASRPVVVTARRLHERMQQGDADARAVLEVSARRTGQVCGMLADLVAPQVIVLGSFSRYFGPWWVEAVRTEFIREALPINGGQTKIVPSGLAERLQDLSAIAPCVFEERYA